jgi:DNA-binding IclR family transcriptional regulator
MIMKSKVLLKFNNILNCFTTGNPRWTASGLARHLRMPVSTLHGTLEDLVEMDFLAFSPAAKEYTVGFRYMEFGSLHSNVSELNNIALSSMYELVFSVNYLAGLSVMYKGWMYVSTTVLPLQSTQGLRYVGPCLPAHLSAGGMAILAYLPSSLLADYCVLKWDNRIIAPLRQSDLERELAAVRECGYAWGRSFAKHELPETVAVPVFGKNRQPLAALVIIGPYEGFPPERKDFCLDRLTAAANDITLRCGHLYQNQPYI